jgi:hypothetical protein
MQVQHTSPDKSLKRQVRLEGVNNQSATLPRKDGQTFSKLTSDSTEATTYTNTQPQTAANGQSALSQAQGS